ncbi:MAG: hypothetical protein WCA20_07175 [Candidatus Sulfotelmatobacter sp.]
MKFAGKYELSDEVTTGRVETFVGRDVAKGERVLVCIFDAPPKKPDQPTVQWVLESFRAVAPDPPGLVLATGKYDGTTYAYLVTQLPDDAVLRQWTQSYESFGTGTREITIGSKNISAESAVTLSFSRPNERGAETQAPAHQPTDAAARFSGLPPPAEIDAGVSMETRNISAQSDSAGEDWSGLSFGPLREPRKREPGEFTREFLAGSNEPPQPASPAFPEPASELSSHPNREVLHEAPRSQEASRPERAASPTQVRGDGPTVNDGDSAAEDMGGGGFTGLFRPSKPEERDAAASVVGGRNTVDDGKPGDFTRFFRGPFDGERPLETPPIVADVSRTPQRNAPGEFTRVFGSSKDNSFSAMYPSAGEVEETSLKPESGAFTRSFGDASQPSPSIEPLPISERNASSQTPLPLQDPSWIPPSPTPVEVPVNPPLTPMAPRVGAGSRRPSIQNGATQAFSAPSQEVSTSLPPPATGPSQYTRIISGGFAGSGALKDQPAAEGSPHSSGGLLDFEMPASAPPKITAPPAPKPPVVAAPAAPKLPEIGALPKAKKSSLPMVIILNVLLLIAVLLIVYFAIKH